MNIRITLVFGLSLLIESFSKSDKGIKSPNEILLGLPPRIPFNSPFQWGYSYNSNSDNVDINVHSVVRFDYTLAQLIAPSGDIISQQPNGTLAKLFPERIDKSSSPYTFSLPPGTQSQSRYSKSSNSSNSNSSKRSSSVYNLDAKSSKDVDPQPICTNNTGLPYLSEWTNATEPGKWTVDVQSIILYGSDDYENNDDGSICISPPFNYERIVAKSQFSVSTIPGDEDNITDGNEESQENGNSSATISSTSSIISASATSVTATFSPTPTGDILLSSSLSINPSNVLTMLMISSISFIILLLY